MSGCFDELVEVGARQHEAALARVGEHLATEIGRSTRGFLDLLQMVESRAALAVFDAHEAGVAHDDHQ
jgi:hypothetical protein